MATLKLAEQFAPALAARPGLSGFAVLQEGAKALLSRTALATQATERIDLQYYIYAADHSGLTLLLHLAAAADRGVTGFEAPSGGGVFALTAAGDRRHGRKARIRIEPNSARTPSNLSGMARRIA